MKTKELSKKRKKGSIFACSQPQKAPCKGVGKVLLTCLLVNSFTCLQAQVAIGELAPPADGALLDLNKAVKGGLVLSNVDLENLYTIPLSFPGMDSAPVDVKTKFIGALVFHSGANGIPAGVYVWNGTNWTPATDNCLPADMLNWRLEVSPSSVETGVPATFTALSDASARCAEGETATSWTVAPSAGVTVSPLPASPKASVSFGVDGFYTVSADAKNPYSTATQRVSQTVIVGNIPQELQTAGYYLTGKPCYDIAQTDDARALKTAAARAATKTDFSVPAARTRTYKFYHDGYSNLSVSMVSGSDIVESFTQPVSSQTAAGSDYETFTVTFKDNVESLVTGNAYSVKLLATYIPSGGSDFKLAYMDISVQDSLCGCPEKNGGDWLVFQCHNLGGNDIFTDSESLDRTYHGDWYKFGAPVASLENTQGNDSYNNSSDWSSKECFTTSGQDWPAGKNPCPAGWRLPTKDEWKAVMGLNTTSDGSSSTDANSSTASGNAISSALLVHGLPICLLILRKSVITFFCRRPATGTAAVVRWAAGAAAATTGAVLRRAAMPGSWACTAATRSRTAPIGRAASQCAAWQQSFKNPTI